MKKLLFILFLFVVVPSYVLGYSQDTLVEGSKPQSLSKFSTFLKECEFIKHLNTFRFKNPIKRKYEKWTDEYRAFSLSLSVSSSQMSNTTYNPGIIGINLFKSEVIKFTNDPDRVSYLISNLVQDQSYLPKYSNNIELDFYLFRRKRNLWSLNVSILNQGNYKNDESTVKRTQFRVGATYTLICPRKFLISKTNLNARFEFGVNANLSVGGSSLVAIYDGATLDNILVYDPKLKDILVDTLIPFNPSYIALGTREGLLYNGSLLSANPAMGLNFGIVFNERLKLFINPKFQYSGLGTQFFQFSGYSPIAKRDGLSQGFRDVDLNDENVLKPQYSLNSQKKGFFSFYINFGVAVLLSRR